MHAIKSLRRAETNEQLDLEEPQRLRQLQRKTLVGTPAPRKKPVCTLALTKRALLP